METDFYRDILCTLEIGFAYHKIISNKKDVDFKLIECNEIFEKLTGLNRHECINNNLTQIINNHAENDKLIDVYKKIADKQHTSDFSMQMRHLNKYLFISIYYKEDDNFLMVAYDITNRIKYIRKTVENICIEIKSTIFVIEPESGQILHANDDACSFYGYEHDEIINKSLFDFTFKPELPDKIPPEHLMLSSLIKKSIKELIKLAVKTGKSCGYFQQRDKDGNPKDVILYFNYSKIFDDGIIFVTVQDKTDIMNIAKKLRKHKEYYQILFEDAPLSCQTLDKNGKVIKVNKEWLKMLGYEKKDVQGKWFGDFLVEEYTDNFRNNFRKGKQEDIHEVACEMYKKNGRKISVNIKTKILRDRDGKFLQCNCILQDISSMIETQEREKTLSKTKNEFLAIISHEVRTPLTSILGLNQLLLDTDLNEAQIDYVNKISNAGRSLLGIINDMLDITKYESGKMNVENQPFTFDSFTSNIVTMNKMLAEKSCNSFEYDIDKNIPNYLIGDALRLGQVINNILGNSFKFTRNGKISLSIRLSGRTKDHADLQILIRDTGIGMTKEQVKKLFVPFEQADTSFARKYGGSGLGMAISKQLIDLMGGNISVESIYSEGTIFIITLTLPIDKTPHKNMQTSSVNIRRKALLLGIQGKEILVVDDHALNRKIICDILKFYKLNIDTAGNGIDAINKVKEKYYDLILMDIQMPEMDGLSATRYIRDMEDKKKRNIPILAMTAHAMKEEYLKSIDAGMNDHITKPIDVKALEESLLKYLKGIELTPSKLPEEKETKDSKENEPIDIRIGLIRFNNDADAYKSSLIEFLSYKKADKKLLKMLKKDNKEEALRYLHSIKGLAGNLSINELSQAAEELREYLSNKSSVIDESDITHFSDNLKKAIEAIECKSVFNRIDLVISKHVGC